jgi:hypothetical protein
MLIDISKVVPLEYFHTIENILRYFAFKYRPEKKWDRIYITTLFTFYWKQTKNAIEFAKKVVKSIDGLYVGGVAASLIPEIIAEETGLEIGKNIIIGLLDKPSMFDDNDLVIDSLVPDYSILETVDYKYPLDTGFLAYMTRGCTRSCAFCAVPKLEPIYKDYISIKKQLEIIERKFGDKKDLILMDNNVLGSPLFPQIIEEIKEMGFTNDSSFIEPNHYLVLVEHLQKEQFGDSERKYIEAVHKYLIAFGKQKIKPENIKEEFLQILHDFRLDNLDYISKEGILSSREILNEFIEKYRNKFPKKRYVDFNQGIDCRYVDEEKMRLLSQIPIRPMRIAFDHISLRKPYENAIRLADKYGIKRLSNYILFNYKDKPEHLWQRLKINIELNEELNASIFSFPMKYIPLYGRESLDRSYIGIHWNYKYLRAIQNILNVLKGVCMPGKTFFEKAFGRNLSEYFDILMMPESYIIYRFHFEQNGKRDEWYYQYKNLNSSELREATSIILANDFFSFDGSTSKTVLEFLKHYQRIWRSEEIKSEQIPMGEESWHS